MMSSSTSSMANTAMGRMPNSVRHKSCLEAPDRFRQEFPSFLRGWEGTMWPLHPGGYQKICSGGPEKCPQDGRIALLKPLFWHAKHAQNVHAKFVPDSIGLQEDILQ